MRIRSIFLLCMSLTGAAAALGATVIAAQQWQRWGAAVEARSVTDVLAEVARMAEKVALERGILNQLLLAENPATPENLESARRFIDGTEGVMTNLQAAAASLPTELRGTVGARIPQLIGRIREARTFAQREIAKPRSARETDSHVAYAGNLMRVMGEALDVIGVLEVQVSAREPGAGDTASMISLAMDIREIGGGRSTWLTQYVASRRRFTDEQMAAIHQATGRVAQAFDRLRRTVAQGQPSERIARALQDMERGFIAEGSNTYRRAIEAGRTGGEPPIADLMTWRNWTQASLATIVGMRDAAIAETVASLDGVINRARWSAVAAVAGLLLVVGLVVGLALFFDRRVVRVLVRLTGAVEKVAAGDYAVEVPGVGRADEIGDIAKALLVFKDNVRRIAEEAERTDASHRADRQRAKLEAELLDAVVAAVEAVRRGDFSVRASAPAELGTLAKLAEGLNAVTRACEDFLDETDHALSALAARDLTQRMPPRFEGRLGRVAENFNRTAEALSETVREVSASADETRGAADDIRAATANLSQRAESQASALEETAAAVEEIAKTIATTSQTVDTVAAKAQDTAHRAARGVEVAGEAVAAIDRVEAQARKIVEIVGVMDSLAFQTNLLALNASVEAARAGEAGRGFAVVANEVRRLAQQSAEASQDVRSLVSETETHVGEGVRLVKAAGEQLGAITGAVQDVAATFAEIRHAAREQSEGVAEISKALQQMDVMTQQNAALAGQSADSARSLEATSQRLTDLTSQFEVGGGRPRLAHAA